MLCLIGVLYAISLFMPICYVGHGSSWFVWGWLALLMGWMYMPWYANPLMLAAILVKNKLPYISIIFASLAIICGINFLEWKEVWINEAGYTEEITGYGGYYYWMAAITLTLIYTLL